MKGNNLNYLNFKENEKLSVFYPKWDRLCHFINDIEFDCPLNGDFVTIHSCDWVRIYYEPLNRRIELGYYDNKGHPVTLEFEGVRRIKLRSGTEDKVWVCTGNLNFTEATFETMRVRILDALIRKLNKNGDFDLYVDSGYQQRVLNRSGFVQAKPGLYCGPNFVDNVNDITISDLLLVNADTNI